MELLVNGYQKLKRYISYSGYLQAYPGKFLKAPKLRLNNFLNFSPMTILQIEHKVPNYEGWKKAFDSDPIDRKKSGVKRYRVFRPTDDPNYVIIDLEFDTISQAQQTLEALKNLWGKVEGTIMMGPKSRLLDVVEVKEY